MKGLWPVIRTDAHEKIALWILQIYTNSTLKYKITHQPGTSSPNLNPPLDLNANKDVLGILFKSATNLNREEARKYFDTLLCVAKHAVPDKEDLRLDLINKGKLSIYSIPELNGEKRKILNYILNCGQKLTHLELSGNHDWNDDDLEEIVKACPNLKTFITYSWLQYVTAKGTREILKLVQLETLHLYSSYIPDALDSLKNLKELYLVGGSVPPLDNLTQLESLTLWNSQKIPPLDNLQNLKNLDIMCCNNTPRNFKIPKLDNLVGLETLNIWTRYDDIPPLTALVNLVDLTISSSNNVIPSLKNQGKLSKLSVNAKCIESIEVASQAPLQTLTLRCAMLKDFPKFDKPESVHFLCLENQSQTNPSEFIKQFSNLRRLSSSVFSTDIMNQLPLLEDLSINGSTSVLQFNNISSKQKRQLKKLEIDASNQLLVPLDDFVNLEECSMKNVGGASISLEKNAALKKFTIQDSPIKRLEHLDKLTRLTHLDLRKCPTLKLQKTSVNAIENLTCLIVLNCDKIQGQKKLISERLVRLKKAVFKQNCSRI